MIKKICKKCKKKKAITSYSGICNSCLNPNAQAMGKLSAKARKKIHNSEHYRKMGKRSAELRMKQKIE